MLNEVRSVLRASLLVLLCSTAIGCTSLDCEDPTRYVGAELQPPVSTPDGLDPVEVRDNYTVPGGAPPKDYKGGACLVKPPQLVAPPSKE